MALHAGSALALAAGLRGELGSAARRPWGLLLATAPAAVAGLLLERPVQERLGGPVALAAGLAAGGCALAAADRCPQRRRCGDARGRDWLAIGAAQACALAPGVSRSGASLAAARALGFRRGDAAELARTTALPVLAGATALKGVRLARRGAGPATRRALSAGVLASFASTLAALPAVRALERDRPLWPWAAYRGLLALALLAASRARRRQMRV